MDSAFKVSDKVELVTPARFLFDAGSTPKAWNRKMLNDPHFKVMSYKADASSALPNTDIKGGVAVTYRDADRDFGAIEVFTHFDELRTIKEKVVKHGIQPLGDIIFAADSYHFTEAMHEDHPEIRYVDDDHGLLSKNHDYDLKTNVLDNLNNVVFFDEMPGDGDSCIRSLAEVAPEELTSSFPPDISLRIRTSTNGKYLFLPPTDRARLEKCFLRP